MTRLASIEAVIANLDRWLNEYDAARWDQQTTTDSTAGRLDHLIAEALADHAAGRTTPL